MARHLLFLLALGGIPLLAISCSGEFLLHEGSLQTACGSDVDCGKGETCQDSYCVDLFNNPCSVNNPDGLCPFALACCGGICNKDPCTVGCDDCAPDEGCAGGDCIDLDDPPPGVKICSSIHRDGLCPGQELCVAGRCVPCEEEYACSEDRTDGCCPPGAECSDGICLVPPDEEDCSDDFPSGDCPLGYECKLGVDDKYSCERVACSATEPMGSCPRDEVCRPNECVDEDCCFPLDCDINHPDGFCPEGKFCSAGGSCATVGTCLVALDCAAGFFCSAHADCLADLSCPCIPMGQCAHEDDCQHHYTCEAPLCVRDLVCTTNDDCLPDEFCGGAQVCLEDGQCTLEADCASNEDCAVAGVCIPENTCYDDRDCLVTEFCTASSSCLALDSCATADDCPPEQECESQTCVVPSDKECTSNDQTDVDCEPDELVCCPSTETCCPQGERCGADDGCIPTDTCIDNSDCPGGAAICVDYACVPDPVCTDSGDCNVDERCGLSGICLPDDPDACATDEDCPDGEWCNAHYECEPDTRCGAQKFTATLVEPNMLIVLDRSGSMSWGLTCGNTSCAPPSRWSVARQAIDAVTAANEGNIRFGLVTFRGSASRATPEVPVGDTSEGGSNAATIMAGFDNSGGPTGATPTGIQLRRIASESEAFLLPDPDDAIQRPNYILLITDGRPTQAGLEELGVCDNYDNSTEVQEINCVLDFLAANHDARCAGLSQTECTCEWRSGQTGYDTGCRSAGCTWNGSACQSACSSLNRSSCDVTPGCSWNADTTVCVNAPPIQSFVVGFVGGSPENNNCHAVHGGTSRCGSPAQCTAIAADQTACEAREGCAWSGSVCEGGIDSSTSGQYQCDVYDPPICHHPANDYQELADTFTEIAGQISSCTYSLDRIPPNDDRLFVYLDNHDGTALVPVGRDFSRQNGFDYDPVERQVLFFGTACTTLISSSEITPAVVYGCEDSGG